ncbi:PhnE/PtxC family ABC transporter permease [Prochlorococcus marinus]|uniref:PhnE/PtxC family ABC transporter permease n=1 Tax=Prochlorococcus marinus TaxID=1219 RepID=UPI0022B3CF61|nr:phosphate ABC transporter permease [Prochlorococcus marinus]
MRIIIAKPILAILPVFVLIPITLQITKDIHMGGLYNITKFIISAVNPSINQSIIRSSLNGIQVTLFIAIISWSLSVVFGIMLGLLSSDIFYKIIDINPKLSKAIKIILSIPRATHELIWGLLLLQFFGLKPWIAIVSIVIPYSCLMARVFSEQINQIDITTIIAIKHNGASKFGVLITALLPKIIPLISSYGYYRLECAIRGATALGIFGLGGIGTELQLTIQSLEFRDMWTSLWLLFITIIILEKIVHSLQSPNLYQNNIGLYSLLNIIVLISSLIISIIMLQKLGLDIFSPIKFHSFNFDYNQKIIIKNMSNLPWIKLFFETISMTVLSSSIAISVPPLLLMILPFRSLSFLIDIIFIFFRVIPSPLLLLLLLLCTTPSIYVAALALGIQNLGVMGRILKENIAKLDNCKYSAIRSVGASSSIGWFYGKFCSISNNYLTYSAYRSDVILRETIVVGAIGGVGLGWQLRESLSSFAWDEVLMITMAFILITLIGEALSRQFQNYLKKTNEQGLTVKT